MTAPDRVTPPDVTDNAVKVGKDATSNASLVVFLVGVAAVGVFFFGSGNGNEWPAAVAVCGLSAMGAVATYLILRR